MDALVARRRRFWAAAVLAALGSYLGCFFVVLAHRRGLAAFAAGRPLVVDPNATSGAAAAAAAATDATAGGCQLRLPDLGFELVPSLAVPELTEFWMLLGIGITAIRFTCAEHGYAIVRRWLLCTALLATTRGFSRLLTVRPVPETGCTFEDDATSSSAWVALKAVARQTSTCADVLFSLHVVNLTLCGLVWISYDGLGRIKDAGATTQRRVRLVVLLYCAVGYYLILATRSHYTTDLFVWTGVSALLWAAYHLWAVLLRLEQIGVLGLSWSLTWPGKLVLWFEEGAEDLPSGVLDVEAVARLAAGAAAASSAAAIAESGLGGSGMGSVASFEDDPEFDSAFAEPHARSVPASSVDSWLGAQGATDNRLVASAGGHQLGLVQSQPLRSPATPASRRSGSDPGAAEAAPLMAQDIDSLRGYESFGRIPEDGE